MFTIASIVGGLDTEVFVQEPNPWNSNAFKITFRNRFAQGALVLKLDNGQWISSSLAQNEADASREIEQLELNSIGYKIARHWCLQLEQQLENFQLSV